MRRTRPLLGGVFSSASALEVAQRRAEGKNGWTRARRGSDDDDDDERDG